jgi:hypothetical protein
VVVVVVVVVAADREESVPIQSKLIVVATGTTCREESQFTTIHPPWNILLPLLNVTFDFTCKTRKTQSIHYLPNLAVTAQ